MKCGGRFEVWLQTLLAENAKIVGINWRVWQLKKSGWFYSDFKKFWNWVECETVNLKPVDFWNNLEYETIENQPSISKFK